MKKTSVKEDSKNTDYMLITDIVMFDKILEDHLKVKCFISSLIVLIENEGIIYRGLAWKGYQSVITNICNVLVDRKKVELLEIIEKVLKTFSPQLLLIIFESIARKSGNLASQLRKLKSDVRIKSDVRALCKPSRKTKLSQAGQVSEDENSPTNTSC